MEKILKKIKIGVPAKKAFKKFIYELNEWWPKEYTWSQEKLQEIRIDGHKNGLCTEIGPYGFRCDWGRVTEMTDNASIGLKWQIGPKREPVPNPENASDLYIHFDGKGDSTTMNFEHYNFHLHGEGSDDYLKMMDSKQGWDYILSRFKAYCEQPG